MSTFDVSFLNPNLKSKSTQDYGFLIDQISIKQNRLEADGKLAPGDYDALIAEVQKVYSHPGLSAAQRSDLDVKLSQYTEAKSKNKLKDSQDIARLNRELEDDFRTQNMMLANNPEAMLRARSDAYRLKLDRLSQSIDELETAGDDATQHYNEFNQTINDWNDLTQTIEDVKGYKNGEPKSQTVAYIKTNSRGEISEVKFGRVGAESGFVETNGVYGGMKIYGKVNAKEGGSNIFRLGNTTFSAPDITTPDPNNPLASRPAKLISQNTQQQRGNITTSQSGQFDVIDLQSVPLQSSIREGSYARGSSGHIYERLAGGQYRKYVDANVENLGISEGDILPIPSSFEQNIMPSVSETVDGTVPFTPPTPAGITPGGPTAGSSTQAVAGQPSTALGDVPGVRGRGPTQPTQRAPKSSKGIVGRALGAAGGFFKNILGF